MLPAKGNANLPSIAAPCKWASPKSSSKMLLNLLGVGSGISSIPVWHEKSPPLHSAGSRSSSRLLVCTAHPDSQAQDLSRLGVSASSLPRGANLNGYMNKRGLLHNRKESTEGEKTGREKGRGRERKEREEGREEGEAGRSRSESRRFQKGPLCGWDLKLGSK